MKTFKYIIFLLVLIFLLIVVALFQIPDKKLHVIACDVGQGDGILIIYKNLQIVTDGGPDTKVLNCLGKHIPFWDRKIEMVISTHSDADHLTGITEILKRYRVNKLVINPINSGTQLYRLLQNQVGGQGIEVVNPTSGMTIGLGLIYLDILSPLQSDLRLLTPNVSQSKLNSYKLNKGINLYSIAYRLRFKNFSALMLGDIPPDVSDELSQDPKVKRVDYIKVPHHGSKTGLTQNLLELSRPKVAIISAGKNNLWGFPSVEVLQMLQEYNVKVLRTDELGDVEIITDGVTSWYGN